jgi:hypothetical protein
LQTDGSHIIPAVHAVHAPLLHTMPAPQTFPLGALPPSMHSEAPVAHDVLPILHGLSKEQVASGVQATQLPLLQNILFPQGVPLPTAAPVSVQSGVPVAQDKVPTWHLFVGVQVDPALQATQAPSLQTFPPPQSLPFAAEPAATHVGVPPPQSIFPVLQPSGKSHDAPATHAVQVPSAAQTFPEPQDRPAATGRPVSLQVGAAAVQSRVPS